MGAGVAAAAAPLHLRLPAPASQVQAEAPAHAQALAQVVGSAAGAKDGPIDPKCVRVLVVDSKSSSRQATCRLLEDASYQVLAVRTSREALQVLRSTATQDGSGRYWSAFDLVLKAHEPPTSSAVRLLKHAARSEVLRQVPIVVTSEQDDRGTVANCLALGAADYLVKPLRNNEVRSLWTRIWWWSKKAAFATWPDSDAYVGEEDFSDSDEETKCDNEDEQPTSKEGSAPDANANGSNLVNKAGNQGSRVGVEANGDNSDNKDGMRRKSGGTTGGSNCNGASTTLAHEHCPDSRFNDGCAFGSGGSGSGSGSGIVPESDVLPRFLAAANDKAAQGDGKAHGTAAARSAFAQYVGPPGGGVAKGRSSSASASGSDAAPPKTSARDGAARAAAGGGGQQSATGSTRAKHPAAGAREKATTGAGRGAVTAAAKGGCGSNPSTNTASDDTVHLQVHPSGMPDMSSSLGGGMPHAPPLPHGLHTAWPAPHSSHHMQSVQAAQAAQAASAYRSPQLQGPGPYPYHQLLSGGHYGLTQQLLQQAVHPLAMYGNTAPASAPPQNMPCGLDQNHAAYLQHLSNLVQDQLMTESAVVAQSAGQRNHHLQQQADALNANPQLNALLMGSLLYQHALQNPPPQQQPQPQAQAPPPGYFPSPHRRLPLPAQERSASNWPQALPTGAPNQCSQRSKYSSVHDSSLSMLPSSANGVTGSHHSSLHDDSQGRRAMALDKYRMKRKNLKFSKTIRYESRKQLAQQRPRIKGQFVKHAKDLVASDEQTEGAQTEDALVNEGQLQDCDQRMLDGEDMDDEFEDEEMDAYEENANQQILDAKALKLSNEEEEKGVVNSVRETSKGKVAGARDEEPVADTLCHKNYAGHRSAAPDKVHSRCVREMAAEEGLGSPDSPGLPLAPGNSNGMGKNSSDSGSNSPELIQTA